MGSFGGEGGEFFVLEVEEDRLYNRMTNMATSTSERVSLLITSAIICRRFINSELAIFLLFSVVCVLYIYIGKIVEKMCRFR